jgi:hypothetical protein
MKRFIKSKKGLALLAALVVAIAASVGAYAYFSNGGTSTGTPATVGTVAADQLSAVFAPNGGSQPDLLPTAANSANKVVDSFDVTVTNASEAALHVSQIVYSVDPTWSSQSDNTKPACDASDFSVGGQPVSQSYTVAHDTDLAPASDGAAASHTYANDVTLQMIDKTNQNQDNCQGVQPRLKAVIS